MVLEMHQQLAPGISSPPVIRIRGVEHRTDEYSPMRILETVERGQSYCGSSDSRAMWRGNVSANTCWRDGPSSPISNPASCRRAATGGFRRNPVDRSNAAALVPGLPAPPLAGVPPAALPAPPRRLAGPDTGERLAAVGVVRAHLRFRLR